MHNNIRLIKVQQLACVSKNAEWFFFLRRVYGYVPSKK